MKKTKQSIAQKMFLKIYLRKEKKKPTILLADLPFLVSSVLLSVNNKKEKSSPIITQPKKKKQLNEHEEMGIKFHEFVSKGLEHVCTSCSQVFFSVKVIKY